MTLTSNNVNVIMTSLLGKIMLVTRKRKWKDCTISDIFVWLNKSIINGGNFTNRIIMINLRLSQCYILTEYCNYTYFTFYYSFMIGAKS